MYYPSMRRLVVFDVDGTLTLTMDLDTELYVEAVKQALDIGEVDTDWSTYRNVTDAGVTAEIIERRFGRPTQPSEIQAVRDRFLALIGSALSTGRERCQPVPGAAQMLSVLRAHPDFECAVATGAWRASALLKTRCAGLAIEDLPLVTADDSPRREEILERAVERARSTYRLSERADAIYVGDGVWDVRAAQAAGLAFLGVGTGLHAVTLRAAGASNVIEDFTDIDRLLELLNGVVA